MLSLMGTWFGTDATTVQVEELRQQIRVLQAVGYGSMDAEDSAAGSEGPSRDGTGGHVGSLENLLLSKARRLEHELTMARLRLSEVAGFPSLWKPLWDLPFPAFFVPSLPPKQRPLLAHQSETFS